MYIDILTVGIDSAENFTSIYASANYIFMKTGFVGIAFYCNPLPVMIFKKVVFLSLGKAKGPHLQDFLTYFLLFRYKKVKSQVLITLVNSNWSNIYLTKKNCNLKGEIT